MGGGERLATIDAMTIEEAYYLVDNPPAFLQWCMDNDAAPAPVISRLLARIGDAPPPPPPPPPPNPRRPDSEALLDFVEHAARLPYRQREVARLCLAQGLSLTECGNRLGISRETVRVHLRRLRACFRMVLERESRVGP